MPSLATIQTEILKYFQGKETNPDVLSRETLDELAIYKSLVINSMKDYIEKVFQCSYLLLQKDFQEIIQDYLELYPSKSPIFFLLAKDFPTFIASDFFQNKYNPPNFLAELALYEWSEVEVQNSANRPVAKVKLEQKQVSHKDLFQEETTSLQLNPVYRILNLKYPISQIKVLIKNSSEADLHELRNANVEEEGEKLIIFRDSESCKTRFFTLAEAPLFIIEAFRAQNSEEEIFKMLCSKFNLEANAVNKSDYDSLILELKKNNILLE